MIFYSLVLEVLVAAVMLGIVAFSWSLGRREDLNREKGWREIFAGFCLLFLGSLVDISDHYPELSRFVILGHTPWQSFVEKVVGFLGGFVLLAIGLLRWLPQVVTLRQTERELRRTRAELEQRLRLGSEELSLRELDLKREVRERIQTAAELERSRNLLRRVVASAPIALVASDGAGKITLAEGRALGSLGLGDGELVGWQFSDLDKSVGDDLERARQGERVVGQVEVDGRVFEYQHAPWERNEGGQDVISVAIEVTEIKRAERELRSAKEAAEASSRAKSQFLANMSHELRTPLNSVIGFASVLHRNKPQNLQSEQLRYLERIRANGQHLLTVINEILDLARIEAGRVDLDLQMVNLTDLVKDTVTQIEGEKRSNAVSLQIRLPTVLPLLRTDPTRLRQVLINLLSNALKFTEQGKIEVLLEVDEAHGEVVRIAVADTGIGIASDQLNTIFDAFRQVDSGADRQYGGTGLGLSISSSLCRLMGFRLWAESVEGRGSTFTIELLPSIDYLLPQGVLGEPAGTQVSRQLKPLSSSPLDSRELSQHLLGKHILVIDDSTDSRLLMVRTLEDMGCRPSVAASGEEGLWLARSKRPDLILLDLMMPQMSGWDVLAALKRDTELASVPVLVVSIVAEEQRGTLLGAIEAVSKPVDRRRLLGVLERVFRQQPARILLVEDDELQQTLMKEILENEGIHVEIAANGIAALKVLEEFVPDLVLVDLVMPEMDGTSLIHALRSHHGHCDLPIAVVTSKELSASERHGLEPQVAAILDKGGAFGHRLQELVAELLREQW
jgi:PAS domain S-box-containing protein